jgi:hypothetical protein
MCASKNAADNNQLWRVPGTPSQRVSIRVAVSEQAVRLFGVSPKERQGFLIELLHPLVDRGVSTTFKDH